MKKKISVFFILLILVVTMLPVSVCGTTMPKETDSNEKALSQISNDTNDYFGLYYGIKDEGKGNAVLYLSPDDVQEASNPAPNALTSTHERDCEWDAQRGAITKVEILPGSGDSVKIKPHSTACWFSGMYRLTSVMGLSNIDTSNATDMSYMFGNCNALKEFSDSCFNTANVKNMSYMFGNCMALTELDVSSFNTSNVTDMSYMFLNCKGLSELDLSNFNTSNVTNMGIMFTGCSGLTELDVSNFNTSNATDMSYMFCNCNTLKRLNISSFDTTNVTNMGRIFIGCTALTELDVSNFNTSNVTDMSYMFCNCSTLKRLNISGFNTSNVTDMSYMFAECNSLKKLNVSTFNISKVTNVDNMFDGCSALETIVASSSFDVGKLSGKEMFSDCITLKGDKGTVWSPDNPQDKTYAHLDGGKENPGYFSEVAVYEINRSLLPGVSSISTKIDETEVNYAEEGDEVFVSAKPDLGYQIDTINVKNDTTGESTIIKGDQGKFIMPESDVTVTATAIDPTREYKVTFDSQGGTEVPAQKVSGGGYATEPENPTKTGYVFNGWFVTPQAAGTAFDFDKTPITADITLYADWIKIPVVPQVTGLNAKATDSKTALATWNKVTGLDGIKYEVWRSAGTSGDFKKVATTVSNSYKDTKVITGTKYIYKVRAICTVSGKTYTGKFSKVDYAYPRLFKVTNFSAKALNAAKAQVTWNANGNKNVSYQVYRSTKPNTGFKKVATVTDGKTTYSQTFTPAQSGMKYYYKVRAITKDYTGKLHYATFSKVDYAYPRVATPTGFKAWASGKHTCNCSWNKVAGSNVKYLVYRGTKPTGNWGNAIATTTKTSYTNKNMKSGKKYYYMVRAVQTINGKKYYSNYSAKDYAYPR